MEGIPEQLQQIKDRLKGDSKGTTETVRTILSWFGWQKRGSIQVRHLQKVLKHLGLETTPDFREVYLDNEVTIQLAKAKEDTGPELTSGTDLFHEDGLDELGPTIGTLESAGSGIESVNIHDPIAKAFTLMMTHDYSQLPVMQAERKVEGLISWETIGHSIARGETCKTVGQCMDARITVFDYNESLFTCIPTIIEEEVVLVKGQDGKISGLVTTTDLSTKFQELSEAFLLLGKIETLIRRMINDKFTKEAIQQAKDPRDTERVIERITDMSFGEYVRLLDNDERWERLRYKLDRRTVTDRLKRVNEIRNEVMHFNPDGPDDDDMQLLRSTERFLSEIVR